jgi:hypothetical protein
MEVRLFGELEAVEAGVPVPVRGAKHWALLGPAMVPVLHLNAEPLAQPLEFLVAQPFQPGRAEDRRGGFLVPGADLTQRLGSSHGVIESVFALHGDTVMDDH